MTDNIPPMDYAWDGESMFPRVPRLADKHFVVGLSYRLVPHEERSMAQHRYYFASINEAWKNLPEDLAERFATPDQLRKFALIKAGYYTNKEAREVLGVSRMTLCRWGDVGKLPVRWSVDGKRLFAKLAVDRVACR